MACFVVLPDVFATDNPASVVVKNQRFQKLKIFDFFVSSSFEPDGVRIPPGAPSYKTNAYTRFSSPSTWSMPGGRAFLCKFYLRALSAAQIKFASSDFE
jgi:hypothetical protein